MDYHITTAEMLIFMVLAFWELVWKGLALWRAAQLRQKGWFITILVLNTAGLLPIIYLVFTRGGKHGND